MSEHAGGDVVAIEVNGSATPRARGAGGLMLLCDRLGERFVPGAMWVARRGHQRGAGHRRSTNPVRRARGGGEKKERAARRPPFQVQLNWVDYADGDWTAPPLRQRPSSLLRSPSTASGLVVPSTRGLTS